MKLASPSPIPEFAHLQKCFWKDQTSEGTERAIEGCIASSLSFLKGQSRTPLESRVPGKNYFAFEAEGHLSRAVNADLYISEKRHLPDWKRLIEQLRHGRSQVEGSPSELNGLIYSVVVSFCCSADLLSRGDKQRPGTFFAYIVGFLFSLALGVNPSRQVQALQLLEEGQRGALPTDYIFDLGPGKSKFHLPVKTSTRERIVQIFAHHLILNRVYGNRSFLATPVILAETKVDSRKRIVTEICIPEQWRIFQERIEVIDRFYYLDPPAAYLKLNGHPTLRIKSFGEFFSDVETLMGI